MIRSILWKLRRLVRRGADTDFDSEIAAHDALPVCHRGMSPEEAERAARRQFGNVTLLKEDRSAMQTFPALEELWRDARHAARAAVVSLGAWS